MKFSSNTCYVKCKSLRDNIGSQVYNQKSVFATCWHVPKSNYENFGLKLNTFSSEYWMPQHLTINISQVQVGQNTQYMGNIRRDGIYYHVLHPRRPNKNPAEGDIHNIKKQLYRYKQI